MRQLATTSLQTFFFLFLAYQQSMAANVIQGSSIPTQNRSPIISLYGLARADYHSPINLGETTYRVQLDVSNYLSSGNKEGERLIIDGETWLLTQSVTHQFSEYRLNVDIPFYHHGSGVLDRFVYDFHEWFGMPQNGRTDNRHDEQLWFLERNGERQLLLQSKKNSLGDISIGVTRDIGSSNAEIALKLKLPTGSYSDQSGSERPDIGVSYVNSNPDWLYQRNWLQESAFSFWWGGSVNYISQAPDLSAMDQNTLVMTGRVGASWAPLENLQIKLQFDTNTPIFDSEIRELGWMPVQTSIGVDYQLNLKHTLDFAIVEDLRPRVTPDVIFTLGYGYRF